jgi:hypothetical protein
MSWKPTRVVGNATWSTHSRPLSDFDLWALWSEGAHSRGQVADVDATVYLDDISIRLPAMGTFCSRCGPSLRWPWRRRTGTGAVLSPVAYSTTACPAAVSPPANWHTTDSVPP